MELQTEEAYAIRLAGLASSVQWLMTAPADACFLITALSRGMGSPFIVLAHVDTKDVGRDRYELLVRRHLQHTSDVVVQHDFADTPIKRLASLEAAVPDASTPEAFNKRLKLDDV